MNDPTFAILNVDDSYTTYDCDEGVSTDEIESFYQDYYKIDEGSPNDKSCHEVEQEEF